MYKKNVLHIVEDLKIGGLEELVRIIVTGLDREKYNVYICCIEEGGEIAQELIGSGINVDILGMKSYHNPLNILKLARYIKEKRIDIIHTHMYFANTFGRIAAILAKTPVIISTAYSNYFEYKKRNILMEKFLSRFTDKIIAASNSIKEFTVKQQKISAEKFVVIYDCAATEKFSRKIEAGKIKEELAIDPDYSVVGCVARMVDVKGHAYLIQAAKEVLREYPKVKFLLVGDGPLKEELKSLSEKLGLEKNIIFTGMRRDIPEMLSVMDIFVLPSSLREGCPLSILEAMAMSKPIVATRIGGVPEEVSDGQSGILVAPKDAESLARGIIKLISDKDKAKEMGRVGRKIFEDKFSKEIMLNNIESLYEDLAKNKLTKRILYVDIHGVVWGGGQLSLLGILENIDRKRFLPIVALPYEGDLSERIRSLGIEAEIIPFGTVKNINIFATFFSVIKFCLFIKRKKIDLVHTNALRATFYAGLAAKISGVPLIWHARDLRATRWVDRLLSSLTTHIIAISEIVAERFPWFIRGRQISLIYNGIDIEKFKPGLKNTQIMSEFSIDKNMKVIGTVGHLVSRKGQEIFLQVASKILQHLADVKFLVVGEDVHQKGAHKKELEFLAQELKIKDKVIFTGFRNDIIEMMSVIDVFIFPFKDEAFGRAVIEAMAMAKPVIAYRHGALTEIIQDNETGLLVTADNPDELAEAIIRLINNPDDAERIGKKARIWVEQNFDLKVTVPKIEALYDCLIKDVI